MGGGRGGRFEKKNRWSRKGWASDKKNSRLIENLSGAKRAGGGWRFHAEPRFGGIPALDRFETSVEKGLAMSLGFAAVSACQLRYQLEAPALAAKWMPCCSSISITAITCRRRSSSCAGYRTRRRDHNPSTLFLFEGVSLTLTKSPCRLPSPRPSWPRSRRFRRPSTALTTKITSASSRPRTPSSASNGCRS